MVSFQEIATQLAPKAKSYKNFKIGKSGQTAKERFDQEHCKTYASYGELGFSDTASTIDQCEQFLIDYFKSYPNNDNKQGSAGEMTNSNRYIVYIVWN